MKLSSSSFNPLYDILELFPLEEPTFVTAAALEKFKDLLAKGGVWCDTQQDTIRCLLLLQTIGVLTVERPQIDGDTYLKIGNKINGQVTQQDC